MPTPPNKRITIPPVDVTKTPELKKKLQELAKKNQRPVSDYIRLVLLRHVLEGDR